ncbi:oligosaccharide flippase family protein [Klebsiella pneumoniae subsp. pneumoniae]|uniref:oligosaccharide flippase family protein n=2 Tax=Klebsiella pneumoniae TaxID=573 RepID=UPI0035157538
MQKKNIVNAFWIMSEKIISIFGLFFVTSFVAKYIGPYRFGQIALSIAIFQVVQVISQMGCDNILFKRASKKRHQRYH